MKWPSVGSVPLNRQPRATAGAAFRRGPTGAFHCSGGAPRGTVWHSLASTSKGPPLRPLSTPPSPPNGCIEWEGTSEAAPEAVRQAVGGGCQSGYCRLRMPLKPALRVRGQWLGIGWAPWRGGGVPPHTGTQRGRLWTACGQRCVDSKNSQTTPQQPAQPPIRQLLGAADAQTAHHTTSSTAPTHQRLGSANAETTPAGAPAAAADRTQRPDATCEGKTG